MNYKSAILFGYILVILSGCGNDTSTNIDQPNQTSQEQTTTSQEPTTNNAQALSFPQGATPYSAPTEQLKTN